MSPLEDSLLTLYRRLASTDLACMVGGSIASMIYGEPRATLDIDIIVAAGAEDADRIVAAFPRDRFYFPSLETLAKELSRPRDGSFQVLEIGSARVGHEEHATIYERFVKLRQHAG